MQISNNLLTLLNNQITAEMFSSQLYLGMAVYFEQNSYHGFAAYMFNKAEEEREHALKFVDFMNKANIDIALDAIESPQSTLDQFKFCVDVFMTAYYQEMKITSLINLIAQQSSTDNNYAVSSFIKWFVDEQVQEEDEALTIYQKIQKIIDDAGAIEMMDCHFEKKYGNMTKVKLEL